MISPVSNAGGGSSMWYQVVPEYYLVLGGGGSCGVWRAAWGFLVDRRSSLLVHIERALKCTQYAVPSGLGYPGPSFPLVDSLVFSRPILHSRFTDNRHSMGRSHESRRREGTGSRQ